MLISNSGTVMKAPQMWSPAEWTQRLYVMMVFLCADSFKEVAEHTDMEASEVIKTIESLIVAFITMDEFADNPTEINRRRELFLSSVKGFEKYKEIVSLMGVEVRKKGHVAH